MSLADRDKAAGLELATGVPRASGSRSPPRRGPRLTSVARGVPVATVAAKVGEPGSPNAASLIAAGAVQLVVNTPRGRGPRADGAYIRTEAQLHQVPCLTTVAAARAAAAGIAEWRGHPLSVLSLQEVHAAAGSRGRDAATTKGRVRGIAGGRPDGASRARWC